MKNSLGPVIVFGVMIALLIGYTDHSNRKEDAKWRSWETEIRTMETKTGAPMWGMRLNESYLRWKRRHPAPPLPPPPTEEY